MAAERWLITISATPDRADGREMLELVLAGASLDLAIDVVFCGPGAGYLYGEPARPWRQLTDHRLAGLWYRRDEVATVPDLPGARALEPRELARMKQRARAVLEL